MIKVNIKNGPLFLNWMNETLKFPEKHKLKNHNMTVDIPFYDNDEFETFKFYKPISKMFIEVKS